MRRKFLLFIGVVTICGVNSLLWAMGTENFGNAPLQGNFPDWYMPVINHHSRVYYNDINGNQHFYYRGDTEVLNDVLKKFPKIKADAREVILLPGPGITSSFDKMDVPHDWNFHITGGLLGGMAMSKEFYNVWDNYPTIRIFVGGNISLEKIKIPKGVTLRELADLRKRYLKGLQSDDRDARGYAALFLAEEDSYNSENLALIAPLLDDHVLSYIEEMPHNEDKWLQNMATSALKKIRQAIAEDKPAAAEKRREMLAKISQFVKSFTADD